MLPRGPASMQAELAFQAGTEAGSRRLGHILQLWRLCRLTAGAPAAAAAADMSTTVGGR